MGHQLPCSDSGERNDCLLITHWNKEIKNIFLNIHISVGPNPEANCGWIVVRRI